MSNGPAAPDPSRSDEPDQDAEPTLNAPPEQRPDAGASELEPDGRADSADATDGDDPT